ncbi:hypothetical protein GQ457_16G014850 [Hibiscus cannabinus]
MAAGLQSGYAAFKSAAIPETCGHAIDVPEIILKFENTRSSFTRAAAMFVGQAARTESPGAIISGFKTDGQL